LATVLFTDIVSATEKATALGDRRWHDLLDSHNAVVRRELTRFRGREVRTPRAMGFSRFSTARPEPSAAPAPFRMQFARSVLTSALAFTLENARSWGRILAESLSTSALA
jgi:class 3 adenylate cyclase